MTDYWLDRNRYIFIVVVLIVMWLGFMTFYYLKADEITKDPCSICAKRMGSKILCTTQTPVQSKREYYENGSIVDIPGVIEYTPISNYTNIFTNEPG